MCEAAVSVICCPIFGYLVDISGTRQLPYLFGLSLLGSSMLLLAFAKTLPIFIIARLLQGGATAMVAVAGLALATDSFDKDRLGTAVGYLGSASALGFVLGPFLGGLIYTNFGYEAVFVMAAVLVGVDFILRILLVEKKVMESWIKANTESPDNDQQHITSNPNECLSTNEGGFLLLNLIRQPRILITLWALLVIGIFFSAFDAVSFSPTPQFLFQKNKNKKKVESMLTFPDPPHIC